ncbi:MAG: phosphatidate cytidylyltransferase [Coriobacteriia bacterium]|nr:phosphatidate cytidylyltransferase [Coriobacteriia bacterium]MCL2870115.1 phosphatidate cytidylyltransferase [Coriobacteriia bacterium]
MRNLKEAAASAKGQPAGIKKASLIQRIITGAIFVVIVLACIIAGNTFMLLPILLIVFAVFGTSEFYRIVSPQMPKVPLYIGMIFAASMPMALSVASTLSSDFDPVLGAGGLGVTVALFYVTIFALAVYMVWIALTPQSKAKDAAVSFFGALYLGIPLSSLMLIREMNDGMLLAVAIVFSIWATDSFAYLGGSLFGRHKLAPKISPKKSWEGLVAGTIGAVVFWYIVPFVFTGSASWVAAVIVGVIVSAAALLGDLFQSRIKREAGVKDSGTLLPGHGGILDRIDSLLLTAPVMFIVLSVMGVALGLVAY